jgi:hypothetical protein
MWSNGNPYSWQVGIQNGAALWKRAWQCYGLSVSISKIICRGSIPDVTMQRHRFYITFVEIIKVK